MCALLEKLISGKLTKRSPSTNAPVNLGAFLRVLQETPPLSPGFLGLGPTQTAPPRRVSDVRPWNIIDVYIEKTSSDKAYLGVGREIEGDKCSRTSV